MKQSVSTINVAEYQAHWLHNGDLSWRQSNCYVDLWIEVLHRLSLNPIASFAFTLAADFEGDQWTFFKVPLHDLFLLYGIDVQELNIWQSLLEHVSVQLSRNRLVLVEVDAFYLPDVHDTSYQQAHEKTTIGIHTLDIEERTLGYFHNSGYYTLQGADFDGIFQERALPPYVEFARFDYLNQKSDAELAAIALDLTKKYVARRPRQNPFIEYTQQFQEFFAAPPELEGFHKYAFATLRQYGSCYEYAAVFLKWLAEHDVPRWLVPAEHFEAISGTTQILMLKAARMAKTKKPFDYRALLASLQDHWDQAMDALLEG
ncbi:DUF1839 family protein [Dictyobacter arantiisoli]|uniref:DUF1839 domain-containing protein n=1 Tax=Dictyobacter arantiisoli TaxID=2014874 RepID=A0A5A5T9G4_9CHLR|nr:DUF1839 family protein [Dictyobacter arantiisoli]GCF08028.1 hypothetical protein KDI_15920 [Dictyobacter arantiisoli]